MIGVDVAADSNFAGDDYGTSLSGWKVLLRWLNPWATSWRTPSSSDVATQLAYCCCVKQMEEAIEKHTDLYLKCPVTEFGTLAWDEWNNICAAAEPYVKEEIRKWKKNLIEADDVRTKTWHRKTQVVGRARIVSGVKKGHHRSASQ